METPPTNGDPITGRPVGGTELSWCRAVPGGTGITVLALLLSRSISLPHLRSSLRRLQLSHPMLRGFLPSASAASASKPPPLLISPTPYDEIELIPSDLLPPLAVDGLTPPVSLFHAVIEHEMNRNPWAEPTEGKPVGSFFASVYELNQSGQSVVTLRFHTGVCDRIAGVAILKELMDLIGRGGVHREEMEDAGEEKEGEVGLAIEDLIRKEDAWKPFWARGKDLIGYSLNGLRSTCLQFEDAGSARKSEFVRLVMDAVTTRRLLTACDVKGIKLCSALTSAGFLATHASKNLQKNQSETYSVITLIDCRQYLDPPLNEKHVGFYHSGILNTHTVNGGEGFWDVAMRCHKAYSNAMKNKKHLSDIGELNFLIMQECIYKKFQRVNQRLLWLQLLQTRKCIVDDRSFTMEIQIFTPGRTKQPMIADKDPSVMLGRLPPLTKYTRDHDDSRQWNHGILIGLWSLFTLVPKSTLVSKTGDLSLSLSLSLLLFPRFILFIF
ncbi:hypothetical protein M5K25_002598 [Dendrobium thyrsiflorum]|uniref:Uncharacterized protein n=1 Tax=Dendrobium thyrsiflorum TaxID=117978 RepID=A0ABD0VNM8_DENTH